jgi:peptide/nickel transport system substrate-binding protein
LRALAGQSIFSKATKAKQLKYSLVGLAFLLLCPPIFAHAAPAGDCGTVVIPAGNDITSFSPVLANNLANAQAAQMLYANLLWINRADQIDWSRSLASAVTTPDQGQTYLITLRPWHWSDGTPVTASDLVYDVTLIEKFGIAYSNYGVGGIPDQIASIRALDATHLRVILRHKVNPTWFIYNGLSQLVPLPEHAWRHATLDDMVQLQSTPSFFTIVDGPLRIARFDPDLDVIFIPNPAYDGPKMHFSRFVFAMVESDGALVEQIAAGDLDVVPLPTELFSAVQNLPGVHMENLGELPTWNFILLNFHNPEVAFFNDIRIRQAMADAQDQSLIIRLALHGLGYPVYAPAIAADGPFEAPAIRTGALPVAFNLQKARALIAAAGFTAGPGGIFQKHGQRLAFTVLTPSGSTEQDDIDDIIQRNFRAAGIEMKFRETEFNQMVALQNGPPSGWQAMFMGQFGAGYPSGEAMFETSSPNNPGGYSDKTMDSLITASITKPGLDALFAYELYASAEQPVIFSPSQTQAFLVRNRLHGIYQFFDAGGLAPDALYCSGS